MVQEMRLDRSSSSFESSGKNPMTEMYGINGRVYFLNYEYSEKCNRFHRIRC